MLLSNRESGSDCPEHEVEGVVGLKLLNDGLIPHFQVRGRMCLFKWFELLLEIILSGETVLKSYVRFENMDFLRSSMDISAGTSQRNLHHLPPGNPYGCPSHVRWPAKLEVFSQNEVQLKKIESWKCFFLTKWKQKSVVKNEIRKQESENHSMNWLKDLLVPKNVNILQLNMRNISTRRL